MEFKYFAFVNKDNVVENVIVCNSIEDFRDLTVNTPMGMSPGRWIPVTEKTRKPSKGYNYCPTKNMFYPDQRFKSWHLDEELMDWAPPTPKPEKEFVDGKLITAWLWDEDNVKWVAQTCVNCDPPSPNDL